MSNQTDQTLLSERLHGLEVKMTFILSAAMVLLPVLAAGYWKILDLGEKQGSLTSKVDGYDKEAFMQIASSIKTDNGNGAAATELKEAVAKIVNETMEKRRRGDAVQPGLYYELGKFSANNGDLEQAIDYFQQAVKGNGLDYLSLSSMGACYLWLAQRQKEQESYYATKAIDVLKKAITIKSDHLNAHLNLGICLLLDRTA
jgi:tetratricopeptide (TPR) repeat protein